MTAEEIVERLERGETYFGVDEIDKLALSVLGPTASIADTQLFLDAMKRGSLDAAIALVERVRPGWFLTLDRYSISDDPDPKAQKWNWRVWLKHIDVETGIITKPPVAHAATPAAALIAALLKAEAK